MLKRCFDVLCACFFLLLALPALLLCGILIKLDSEGPILFRQKRMGRNFRPFNLVKLRTMEDHNCGSAYTLGCDPRITRTGQWMRKYKLDELPQLWNVLRGQMSMVGPRPVIPALTYEFYRAYEHLLAVRPGLTDPATLKYYRECEILAVSADPLRYFKTVVTPDKLNLSIEYLQRATVWSDLGLLVRTAAALVPHISDVRIQSASPLAIGRSWTHLPPQADSSASLQLASLACSEEESATGD